MGCVDMSGSRRLSQSDVPSVRVGGGILDHQDLVDFLYLLKEECVVEYREARQHHNACLHRLQMTEKMIRELLLKKR